MQKLRVYANIYLNGEKLSNPALLKRVNEALGQKKLGDCEFAIICRLLNPLRFALRVFVVCIADVERALSVPTEPLERLLAQDGGVGRCDGRRNEGDGRAGDGAGAGREEPEWVVGGREMEEYGGRWSGFSAIVEGGSGPGYGGEAE